MVSDKRKSREPVRQGIRARGKPDGIDEFFPVPPEHFAHAATDVGVARLIAEGILIAPDGTVWRELQFNRSDVEAAFPVHRA